MNDAPDDWSDERPDQPDDRQPMAPHERGGGMPEYYCDALVRWPWLPEKTELLDDEYRNRTREENALWMLDQTAPVIERMTAALMTVRRRLWHTTLTSEKQIFLKYDEWLEIERLTRRAP